MKHAAAYSLKTDQIMEEKDKYVQQLLQLNDRLSN